MVSHWLSGHFLEYSPGNSFSNLKQHYSAALGLGARFWVAPLEEALYKCLQRMNEWMNNINKIQKLYNIVKSNSFYFS